MIEKYRRNLLTQLCDGTFSKLHQIYLDDIVEDNHNVSCSDENFFFNYPVEEIYLDEDCNHNNHDEMCEVSSILFENIEVESIFSISDQGYSDVD